METMPCKQQFGGQQRAVRCAKDKNVSCAHSDRWPGWWLGIKVINKITIPINDAYDSINGKNTELNSLFRDRNVGRPMRNKNDGWYSRIGIIRVLNYSVEQ